MPVVAAAIAHPIMAAMVTSAVASSTMQAQATNNATKAAKSQADTEMRMALASQDALVAKDAADKAELAQGIASAESQAKGVVTQKKRAMARSSNIYTSPLGIGGQADVAKKMLLGA